MTTYSTISYYMSQMFIALYPLCPISFWATPILLYLLYGSVELIVPIYIPMIDATEKTGYIITTASHVYFTAMATAGFCFFDSLISNLILHVLVYAELIENDLGALNQMIADGEWNELDLRIRFRNILIMHKEMRM